METIKVVHKAFPLLILSFIGIIPYLGLCQVTLRVDPVQYLMYYGYLDPTTIKEEAGPNGSKVGSSLSIEDGIREFQIKFGLQPTGFLDNKTKELMNKARCGVPDKIREVSGERRQNLEEAAASVSGLHNTEHYKPFVDSETGKPLIWNSSTVTYFFDETVAQTTDLQQFKGCFQRSFEKWAKVYKFNFLEIQEKSQANITIGFRRGNHSNIDPIDTRAFFGAGNAVAHAYAPPYGMLHFDGDEKWGYIPNADEYDVESIALHEIGHTLGLNHNEELPDAVMWPYVEPGLKKRELNEDDIKGIQFMYGGDASNPK